MKNRIFIICSFFLFTIAGSVSAQGIKFFEGSFDAALAEAKASNKLVFVDFYADWCGPCKHMSEKIFPLAEVGEYFNAKFISVKIDTEVASNKKLVKQYKVNSMPTFLFLDGDGKVLSTLTGSLPAEGFIKAAKVVTGEELGFLALYDQYKASSDDLILMQKVLLEAPSYVSTLEKMEKEKWIIRVDKLFKEYITKKMGPSLVNKEDYKLITTFYKQEPANDKVVEFINANIEGYMKETSKGAGYYILEYQNKVISALAKSGNEEYKKQLDRINGDMKLAYSVMDVNNIPPYEMYKYLYDGEYILYHKGDLDGYIALMEKYFMAMGDKMTAASYAGAAQKMYHAMGKKMAENHHKKAIEWMVQSLQLQQSLMDRVNVIAMLGDSHRDLKKYDEARKFYNQAYMEAMQITQERTKMYMQMAVKKKLSALELLKK